MFLSYLIHNNHRKKLIRNVLKELDVFKIIPLFFVANTSEICFHLPGEREVQCRTKGLEFSPGVFGAQD